MYFNNLKINQNYIEKIDNNNNNRLISTENNYNDILDSILGAFKTEIILEDKDDIKDIIFKKFLPKMKDNVYMNSSKTDNKYSHTYGNNFNTNFNNNNNNPDDDRRKSFTNYIFYKDIAFSNKIKIGELGLNINKIKLYQKYGLDISIFENNNNTEFAINDNYVFIFNIKIIYTEKKFIYLNPYYKQFFKANDISNENKILIIRNKKSIIYNELGLVDLTIDKIKKPLSIKFNIQNYSYDNANKISQEIENNINNILFYNNKYIHLNNEYTLIENNNFKANIFLFTNNNIEYKYISSFNSKSFFYINKYLITDKRYIFLKEYIKENYIDLYEYINKDNFLSLGLSGYIGSGISSIINFICANKFLTKVIIDIKQISSKYVGESEKILSNLLDTLHSYNIVNKICLIIKIPSIFSKYKKSLFKFLDDFKGHKIIVSEKITNDFNLDYGLTIDKNIIIKPLNNNMKKNILDYFNLSINKEIIDIIFKYTYAYFYKDFIELLKIIKNNNNDINEKEILNILKNYKPLVAKKNKIYYFEEILSDFIGDKHIIENIKKVFDNYFIHENNKTIKGLLFYGAAGTGKTYLIKCISGEYRIPYIIRKTKENIKEIYDKARYLESCIIIFDEIDTLVNENVIPTLLTELDGVEENKKIITIGTTNRLKTLPLPLLRSGRMDLIFEFASPNTSQLKEIIRLFGNKFNIIIEKKIIDHIAPKLYEYKCTGADIEMLYRALSIKNINKINVLSEINNELLLILNKKNCIINSSEKDYYYSS